MEVLSLLIMALSTGIAYTIDPEYEAEVKAYLGESDITYDVKFVLTLEVPGKTTEKRYVAQQNWVSDYPK